MNAIYHMGLYQCNSYFYEWKLFNEFISGIDISKGRDITPIIAVQCVVPYLHDQII